MNVFCIQFQLLYSICIYITYKVDGICLTSLKCIGFFCPFLTSNTQVDVFCILYIYIYAHINIIYIHIQHIQYLDDTNLGKLHITFTPPHLTKVAKKPHGL